MDAWNIQNTASNILVALVDTGIRYTHQDLAPNVWTNPGEIAGNGLDDDHNGYIDDVHGINIITGTGNPMDDNGHGSHVAGIMGAVGSNNVGIAGVTWNVKIMACKFLDYRLQGALSDAIEGINYAREKGARIINASWGMPSYNTQALYDAINSTRQAGMLFVAACGNSTNNNDTTTPIYPASFDLDNIIAVAATTRNDALASFSSYGPTTVDLGAPGDTVLSCWAGSDSDYNNDSGTSMAAPHVTGACALVWARFPNESYLQIKNRVLAGVDKIPALAGKCVTGGRLDLLKALQSGPPSLVADSQAASQFHATLVGAPAQSYVIEVSSNLLNWSPLLTNQTSSDGRWTFSDSTVRFNIRFYRAIAVP
jgi:subtilisin family serine protease